MEQISADLKKGLIKIKIDNSSDLWFLSSIIDENDQVSGKTTRKVKIGGDDERNAKVTKKIVFVSINVEKVEFHKYTNRLRVSGTIIEGTEDIPKGSYHTINVEEDTIISIKKERWLKYQLDKLKEATSKDDSNILVCVHDREDAFFGLVKRSGYELLSNIHGNVEKKADFGIKSTNFYKEIIKVLADYDKRHDFSNIVVASPAFFKDEFLKNLKDENLKKKIVTASCSTVSKNSIDEVLKRGELKEALKKDRMSKELNVVEDILKEISTDGNVSYGLKETEKAASLGAIRKIIITDNLIMKARQEDYYNKIDLILKDADNSDAEIFIINSDHEGGKKLDGLGGIAALLRYKIS